MKKKIEREREREREREPFLYRKNMHRMEEIKWQIYNKMMRIRRAKIRKIKWQNNIVEGEIDASE